MTRFRFRQQLIDDSLPGRCYAQTALADFDRDGIPEFVTGQQFGTIFRYRRRADGSWTRHVLGEDSPSDVGACVLDVDGDGWPDLVTGGAWYRNSRHPERPFERIVFDPALEGVHDVLAADLDGDGREEVITMSDRNDLRWYKIPESPEEK
ncbi:MAG: VCBS repeat-containing protein [Anaerolineaceae bacterium]|nr:VCBS repeat-containing protein [Anaerolineaceae bacterium]